MYLLGSCCSFFWGQTVLIGVNKGVKPRQWGHCIALLGRGTLEQVSSSGRVAWGRYLQTHLAQRRNPSGAELLGEEDWQGFLESVLRLWHLLWSISRSWLHLKTNRNFHFFLSTKPHPYLACTLPTFLYLRLLLIVSERYFYHCERKHCKLYTGWTLP